MLGRSGDTTLSLSSDLVALGLLAGNSVDFPFFFFLLILIVFASNSGGWSFVYVGLEKHI